MADRDILSQVLEMAAFISTPGTKLPCPEGYKKLVAPTWRGPEAPHQDTCVATSSGYTSVLVR